VPICKIVIRGHYSGDEKAKQVHLTEDGLVRRQPAHKDRYSTD